MKRPLLTFSAGFIVAVMITLRYSVTSLPTEYYIATASVALVLVIFCVTLKQFRIAGIFLIGALFAMIFTTVFSHLIMRPTAALDGKTYTVTATVRDYAQVYEDSQRVQVTIPPNELSISVPHPSVKSLFYVPLTEQPLMPGDKIKITVHFYSPSVMDGFARKEYYDAEGYYILGAISDDEGLPNNKSEFSVIPTAKAPFWSYPLHFSAVMHRNISTLLPEREAGFLTAVLLGDKSGVSSSDLLAVKKAGLSHAMAVSGMHIGFLVGLFFLLFGRKYGMLLSILAIAFFIPMAGATPSVVRASTMYLLAALGFFLGKEPDSLNGLCLALLVLLLRNPCAIYSISLQLSFTATLGLILFSPRLKRWFMQPFINRMRWLRQLSGILIDGIVCSISTLFFTMPILFTAFGYVSILAPLANLLTLGAVALVFVFGLLAAVSFTFLPVISEFLRGILIFFINYVLWVSHQVASLPYGLVYADQFYGKLAVIVLGFILLLCMFCWCRLKLRFILPPLCAILILFLGLDIHTQAQTIRISFLPSGSGQTILLSAGQGSAPVLIDCAASGRRDAAENVQEWMEWRCFDRIDTLILTAMDKTHARSVPDLLQKIPVGRIIIPANIRQSDIAEKIMETANTNQVPVIIWSGEVASGNIAQLYGLSISGMIDRKLIVQIQAGKENILILHSLTQKMLHQLLSESRLYAKTIVLSESNLEDAGLLNDAIGYLNPETIVLQAGYSKLRELCRKPVRNTMLEGEITFTVLNVETKE